MLVRIVNVNEYKSTTDLRDLGICEIKESVTLRLLLGRQTRRLMCFTRLDKKKTIKQVNVLSKFKCCYYKYF